MSERRIDDSDDDIRLDRWFKRHHPGWPHALVEKSLRKGAIRLDGKKAKTSDRVRAGQLLSYPELAPGELPEKRKAAVDEHELAQARGWVLYKDANVIVINKPFGLSVQGGSKIDKSLDDLLGGLAFDAKERPKLVHRLDRDTSGVLVLARNAKAAASLAKGFAGKGIDKTYWALVHGMPQPLKGTVNLPLVKAQLGNASFERVGVDDEAGKPAKTEYRVLDMLARRFAFMELKPLTGRTHQLRVHMSAIGCPIVGDSKYGERDYEAHTLDIGRQLHLHARRIVIPAAIAGKSIDVSAPLPSHMLASFETLGIDVPKK